MDLIKIICGMLAVAIFLGILTCGAHDERKAIADEPENENVSVSAAGVTGEIAGKDHASEEHKFGTGRYETCTSGLSYPCTG